MRSGDCAAGDRSHIIGPRAPLFPASNPAAPDVASHPPTMTSPELSIVVPVYDEEDNVGPLYERVVEALSNSVTWELLLVDDGSRDATVPRIEALVAEDHRVRGILHPRNLGQTAALLTGFRSARAPLIATLDGDLQNDPADLPRLLALLEGHDAAVGIRAKRRDSIVRRASSRIANAVRNALTGDDVVDTGCGIKLFRAEAARAIPAFEGMHRFFPTLLRYQGFTVVQVPVSHHPRTAGTSKYGVLNRLFRSLRDLSGVRGRRPRTARDRGARAAGRAAPADKRERTRNEVGV